MDEHRDLVRYRSRTVILQRDSSQTAGSHGYHIENIGSTWSPAPAYAPHYANLHWRWKDALTYTTRPHFYQDARDSPIETVLSLTITATALLGCDQLWHFLNTALPRHTIPSGLKLIPSKLGYLLTGRQRTAEEQEGLANASRKRSMRTPEASESLRLLPNNTVFTYTTLPDFENELSRWDKYWTMDSARVCELADRRNDGYYVRLPYKEELALLPSNKTIALKRLTDTFAILRSRPDIMQQYQQTIDSQLKAGIIEIKETTKQRIVVDASSHFKEASSASASDVAKTFLQERLHEQARDATRFFRVRGPTKPTDDDDLLTCRFTRVPHYYANLDTWTSPTYTVFNDSPRDIKSDQLEDPERTSVTTNRMEKPVVDPEGDQRTDPHQAGNPSTDPAKLQEETLITALTQQVALLECDQLEDPQQELLCSLWMMRSNAITDRIKVPQYAPDNLAAINGSLIRAARMVLIKHGLDLAFKGSVWTIVADSRSSEPIALNTPLTALIIKYAHDAYHNGIEHTMATDRTPQAERTGAFSHAQPHAGFTSKC
ncbi:hypothetical protein RB195_025561 [Necator americanus]|uniref:Uncharacterized protein n=1 Tax=Necator americanus TaxID=51031 RepID=A0ABR1ET19_NECAM